MALPSRFPVALFFSQFLPGGTEGQMSELARRLDRSRFEVHIACLHRNGSWLARACDGAASVAEFPITSFRHPATLGPDARVRRPGAGRAASPSLHATDLYANVFALPAAAAAGVPVRIGNRREIDPDKGPALVALQRLAYTFAHRVVANSRRRSGAPAAGARHERVDRDRPQRHRPVRLSTASVRTRLRRIITVANLRVEKAHETLIESAADSYATIRTSSFSSSAADGDSKN